MHPEKVKAMIFLDSGSPEFYSTDSELLAKIMNRGTAFMRAVGINRLLGSLGILLPLYGENIRNAALTDEVKAIDQAMYYRYAGNPATLDSIELINENAKKVLEGPRLGDMPVLVISSDSTEDWEKVQKQLLSWSKNSTLIKVKASAHYIYWSNDTEVTNRIIEFVKRKY